MKKIEPLELFELCARPSGCPKRDAIAAFNVNEKTAEDALRKFEALGLVESKLVPATYGAQRLAYFARVSYEDAVERLTEKERVAPVAQTLFDVWFFLRCEPESTRGTIAANLEIEQSRAVALLKILERVGMVRKERKGVGHPDSFAAYYSAVAPVDDPDEVVLLIETRRTRSQRTAEELAERVDLSLEQTRVALEKLIKKKLVDFRLRFGGDGKTLYFSPDANPKKRDEQKSSFQPKNKRSSYQNISYVDLYDFLRRNGAATVAEIAGALHISVNRASDALAKMVFANVLGDSGKHNRRRCSTRTYYALGTREDAVRLDQEDALSTAVDKPPFEVYQYVKRNGAAGVREVAREIKRRPNQTFQYLRYFERAGFLRRHATRSYNVYEAVFADWNEADVETLARLRNSRKAHTAKALAEHLQLSEQSVAEALERLQARRLVGVTPGDEYYAR